MCVCLSLRARLRARALGVFACFACAGCVWEWLELHCTCPVCRFELETEDVSYERERRVRMQGRRPRYRRTELDGLSIPQIRNLARGQNVNIAGCLEKADIVRCLIESGTVRLRGLKHAFFYLCGVERIDALPGRLPLFDNECCWVWEGWNSTFVAARDAPTLLLQLFVLHAWERSGRNRQQ